MEHMEHIKEGKNAIIYHNSHNIHIFYTIS